jgi:hypothetical protein
VAVDYEFDDPIQIEVLRIAAHSKAITLVACLEPSETDCTAHRPAVFGLPCSLREMPRPCAAEPAGAGLTPPRSGSVFRHSSQIVLIQRIRFTGYSALAVVDDRAGSCRRFSIMVLRFAHARPRCREDSMQVARSSRCLAQMRGVYLLCRVMTTV